MFWFCLFREAGGPSWVVQLGRRDSTTASLSAANSDIPSPLMDLKDLTSAFSNKGFTSEEMVTLSGTRTFCYFPSTRPNKVKVSYVNPFSQLRSIRH